ncbi:hypothetical protein KUCAC02_036302, partial [Chaenocephalus aceratus]
VWTCDLRVHQYSDLWDPAAANTKGRCSVSDKGSRDSGRIMVTSREEVSGQIHFSRAEEELMIFGDMYSAAMCVLFCLIYEPLERRFSEPSMSEEVRVKLNNSPQQGGSRSPQKVTNGSLAPREVMFSVHVSN